MDSYATQTKKNKYEIEGPPWWVFYLFVVVVAVVLYPYSQRDSSNTKKETMSQIKPPGSEHEWLKWEEWRTALLQSGDVSLWGSQAKMRTVLLETLNSYRLDAADAEHFLPDVWSSTTQETKETK